MLMEKGLLLSSRQGRRSPQEDALVEAYIEFAAKKSRESDEAKKAKQKQP